MVLIFDLDGTLADCSHRRHMVEADKPDFKAFYEACGDDKPIIATSHVYASLKKVFWAQDIVIWSGRCESVRRQTEWWLYSFIDTSVHWNEPRLKMRPEGDSTPDDELKERWLDEHLAAGGKGVDMVFDDRPKVVRMWQRRGIFVFNCAQSDKEF